ncbi:hypothetical protein [Amycolatopsis tolypomycina]|uniref:hypothetical protein n=1 Tax=Amycolatopsis tolypomycina TaxID=208445 RepID=UPI0033AEEEB6
MLPMLLVAGIMGAMFSVPVGLVLAFFAGLVVVFDSWANRPAPAPARRRPEPARPCPATAWQPRPPAGRPGGVPPRRAVPQPYYRR